MSSNLKTQLTVLQSFLAFLFYCVFILRGYKHVTHASCYPRKLPQAIANPVSGTKVFPTLLKLWAQADCDSPPGPLWCPLTPVVHNRLSWFHRKLRSYHTDAIQSLRVSSQSLSKCKQHGFFFLWLTLLRSRFTYFLVFKTTQVFVVVCL